MSAYRLPLRTTDLVHAPRPCSSLGTDSLPGVPALPQPATRTETPVRVIPRFYPDDAPADQQEAYVRALVGPPHPPVGKESLLKVAHSTRGPGDASMKNTVKLYSAPTKKL